MAVERERAEAEQHRWSRHHGEISYCGGATMRNRRRPRGPRMLVLLRFETIRDALEKDKVFLLAHELLPETVFTAARKGSR